MRILVFGDSIVQGRNDAECFGWVNRLSAYAQKVTDETDWKKDNLVFNLGICGDRIDRLRERFDVEFDRRRESEEGGLVTIFAYGANDSVTNLKTGKNVVSADIFKEEYRFHIKKAQTYGKVVLCGLTPIDEQQLNPIPWFADHACLVEESGRYNQFVKEIAEETGSYFIDLSSVFYISQTNDGLHPDASGHELMFQEIKNYLVDNCLLDV